MRHLKCGQNAAQINLRKIAEMQNRFEKEKELWVGWIAIIAVLALTVLFPLLKVISIPLFESPFGTSFKAVFTSRAFLKVMGNTLLICICSTLLSVITGFIFAYAVAFEKTPFTRLFNFIPVMHLVTPPFVGGLAFILLIGRQGFFTKTLLGLDISLYGFWGLLIAQTLCFFPIAFLIILDGLKKISRNLIDSAKSLGSSEFRIFTTVILPLSKNALLSALLFIAVSVLSDFGNPLIVGGRFKVLATEIYTQLTGWINQGVSAVLGIVLLLPSVLLFLLQRKKMFLSGALTATIGGKVSGREDKSPFNKNLFFTLFCLFISFCVISQFAAIIAGSFQKLWGIKTDFTLEHVKAVSKYSKHLGNSLFFAFTASVTGVFLAGFTAFLVHRTRLPLGSALDTVIQLPSCVPGSLFGLALSLTAGALHLRNARLLIFIAITVSFMPFSYRIISSGFSSVKTSLDEASLSLGRKKILYFFKVLFPLCFESFFSGFTYNFVRGIGTLSAVIFLVSFNTPLASIAILNLAEQGDWGKSAALASTLTLITFAVLGVSKLISRFSGSKK